LFDERLECSSMSYGAAKLLDLRLGTTAIPAQIGKSQPCMIVEEIERRNTFVRCLLQNDIDLRTATNIMLDR